MIRVNGKDHPWRQGLTIAGLIAELQDPYPYSVVRVDDRAVSRPDFETTTIPDNAEVYLVPMIAGG